MLLSWHKYGGGKELLTKIYSVDWGERGLVPVWSAPDAAARLVQEADHQDRELKGMKFRTVGIFDRCVYGHGRRGERAARR